MSTGLCRGCGADIIWAWTEAGQRMPLDPARYPREDTTANVAVRTDHTGRIWARVISKDRPLAPFEHRGMPHFASCPARPRKPRDELAARRRRNRPGGSR
ncbi:hypothetical protein [Blastococcus sp. CCUG 61487]|uniref:hypothetical protein n=1 Tax=Blastococcus sp. CCUG 61487 TaxID=1840703 RepID=UPI0010C0E68A|nr:hypothetical protein [Blastococcus sp. CCUG 61487]TKJ24341.1 hypothetical protein A6V29_04910 [Blastococcus sp. CCUG 61487]